MGRTLADGARAANHTVLWREGVVAVAQSGCLHYTGSVALKARPEIQRITGYAPGEQPSPGQRLVKLNSGEAPFAPSPKVIAAIRDLEPESLRAYPTLAAERFSGIAAAHHGLQPANVVTGNGTDDILTIALRTFVAPGGSVAMPWPAPSLYPRLCAFHGVEHVKVDWLEGWQLPAAQLLALRPQAILLSNPNAASGTAVAIEALGDLARRLKGLLLIDEGYADFADMHCVPLLAEHDNVVICRTLSRGYALAGLRFGYALAHAEAVEQMLKVRPSYHTSALSETAASAALEDQEYAQRIWEHVRAERARMTLELSLLGMEVAQSQANFVMARHPSLEATELYEGLKKQGVLVRAWSEPGTAGALRITIGSSQENNAFLGALESLLGKGEGRQKAEAPSA